MNIITHALLLFTLFFTFGCIDKELTKEAEESLFGEPFTLQITGDDGSSATEIKLGASKQLVAIARFTETRSQDITQSARWSSSNSNIISVDEKGLLLAKSLGRATIRIIQAGSDPVSITIEVVAQKLDIIEIRSSTTTLSVGTSLKLDLLARFENGDIDDISHAATWRSENNRTADVLRDGTVIGKIPGFVKIKVSYVDLVENKIITDTYDLTVLQKPNALQITPPILKTGLNLPVSFDIYALFSDNSKQKVNRDVEWLLPEGITANSDGSLSATESGVYVVVATLDGLSIEATLIATSDEVTSYSLEPSELSLSIGAQKPLHLYAIYSDGKKQEISESALWSSSNNPVVSVDPKGVVSANALGSVTITAAYNEQEFQARVSVSNIELQEISVQVNSRQMKIGLEQGVGVFAHYEDDSFDNVTPFSQVKSSDEEIVAVLLRDDAIFLSALKEGNVSLIVSYQEFTKTVEIRVERIAIEQLNVIAPAPFLAPQSTMQLSAEAVYEDITSADVSEQVLWESNNTRVVVVDIAGKVTAIGAGEARLFAKLEGLVDSVDLEVIDESIQSLVVEPSGLHLIEGANQLVHVFAQYPNQRIDVSDDAILIIDDIEIARVDQGVVSALKEGTTILRASYDSKEIEAQVEVTKATLESVVITGTNELSVGSQTELHATAHYSNGQSMDITKDASWSSSDSEKATISSGIDGGVLSALAVGDVNISASYLGVSVNLAVVINDAFLERISIESVGTTFIKGTTTQLVAFGYYSDGQKVDITQEATWLSSDTEVANINSGELIANVSGSSLISVGFLGITQELDIVVEEPTLQTIILVNDQSLNLAVGINRAYYLDAHYSNNALVDVTSETLWSVSDTTVAVINGAGVLVGLQAGTVEVIAHFGELSTQTSVTIIDAALTSIGLSQNSVDLILGHGKKLEATGIFENNSSELLSEQVLWSTSDNSVVSISNVAGERGFIRSLGVGSATVWASQNGIESTKIVLNVTNAILERLEISGESSVPVGQHVAFSALGYYSDGSAIDISSEVSWDVSDSTLATIGVNGSLSSLQSGDVNVSATFVNQSSSVILNITEAVLDHVSIEAKETTLIKGTSSQVSAFAYYSDGTKVDITAQAVWLSSDNTVASVSGGLVSAKSSGSVEIEFLFNSVSEAITLLVEEPTLVSLSISSSESGALVLGIKRQYHVNALYSNNTLLDVTSEASWSVSDTNTALVIASGSGAGEIEGVSAGSVTLSSSFGGESAQTSVTIVDATLTSLSLSHTSFSLILGYNEDLSVTGFFDNGTSELLSEQVVWVSSDTNIITVSNASGERGRVRSVSEGVATLYATSSGVTSAVIDITVNSALLTSITIDGESIVPEFQSSALIALGDYSDGSSNTITNEVSWSSDNTDVATVNSVGVVDGVGVGSATITALFGVISSEHAITVTQDTLTKIDINSSSDSVVVGQTLSLRVYGTYQSGRVLDITNDVILVSSDDTTASVTQEGIVSANSLGSVSIKAIIGELRILKTINVIEPTLLSITSDTHNVSVPAGLSQALSVNANYSNDTSVDVTSSANWQSSNSVIAEVSSGVVNAKSIGECIISAGFGGEVLELNMSTTAALLEEINSTISQLSLYSAYSSDWVISGTYSDETTRNISDQIAFSSSDESIATVSNSSGEEGKIRALAAGDVTITAQISSFSLTLALHVDPVVLTSLSLDTTTAFIALNENLQLQLNAHYSDSTVVDKTSSAIWASSNSSAVSVSGGLVSRNDFGIVQIEAALEGSTIYFTADGLRLVGGNLIGKEMTLNSSVDWITQNGFFGSNKFTTPTDITTDGTNFYTVDSFKDELLRVNSSGETTLLLSNLNDPKGVSATKNSLYISEKDGKKIVKYQIEDATTSTLANFSTSPYGLTNINDTLYVAFYDNSVIVKVDENGSFSDFVTGLNGPTALTTDGTYLYVVEYWDKAVTRVLLSDPTQQDSMMTFDSQRPLSISTDGIKLFIGTDNGYLYEQRLDDQSITDKGREFQNPTGFVSDGEYLYIVDDNKDEVGRL
jgi:trimeric autotransporter adhesin